MQKKFAQHMAVFVAAAAFVGAPVPAQAGFQWKSPVKEEMSSQAEPVIEDGVVTPMPGEEGMAPMISVEDVTAEELPPVTADDTIVFDDDFSSAPIVADAQVVTGFGQDLPLIIALRQIVPAEYQFAFADGIDLSTPVSWEGGRPWTDILGDVMASAGLRAEMDGMIVAIGAADQIDTGYMIAMDEEPVQLDVAATEEIDYGTPEDFAPEQMAVLDAPVWEGPRGALLRDVLEEWSQRAGVELFWSSDYNYALEETYQVSGSYEEAVRGVLSEFSDSNPRPFGRLHEGASDIPPVLVIETQ